MRSCSNCISVLTVAVIAALLVGSFQSIFGFEFLVLDARTDRGSFTFGGPRNGGESHLSENIVAEGGNGGNGGNGGDGGFVFGGESGKGANGGDGGDGGNGGSGDNGGDGGSGGNGGNGGNSGNGGNGGDARAGKGGDGGKGGDAYGRSSGAVVRR